jgi:hypothetical protein
MDRFVLRANLNAPLIARGWLTLDAFLMAVLVTDQVSHLVRCEDGLYYASAAFPGGPFSEMAAPFVASLRAEVTPEWSSYLKPNTNDGDVRVGLARQREGGNILNRYVARSVAFVEWYGEGNAQAILETVRSVPAIGKRRSAGYGEVLSWEVDAGDVDGICGAFGEPLRPVPIDRWEGDPNCLVVEAAWKGPYWDVRNRAKCAVPWIPA